MIGALLLLAASQAAGVVPQAASSADQTVGAGVAVVAQPDTVLVGQPFTLGVAVRAAADAMVDFPPSLNEGSDFETVGHVRTVRDTVAGGWRATYRVIGWKAGQLALPPLHIRLANGPGSATGTRSRQIEVTLPAVFVHSVLPPDSAGLSLMPPRGPVESASWWWLLWLLLLALLLALLAWWLRHLRGTEEAEKEWAPASVAIQRLRELESRFAQTGMRQDAFYDGLEEILRWYAEETRPWPAGMPLTALAAGAAAPAMKADLPQALARSMRARFARTRAERSVAAGDVGTAVSWLEGDWRSQEEALAAAAAEPAGETGDSEDGEGGGET